MSENFRFYQNQKNQFIWTDNQNYRIIFSGLSIQPLDEYMPISEHNKAMYYYYQFEILRKHDYDTHWKKIIDTSVQELSGIHAIQNSIKQILTTKIRLNAQCYRDSEDDKLTYTKWAGSAYGECEDFCDIRRFFYDNSEWFDMYLGANDLAVRIYHLTEDDLWALWECIDEFLKYGQKENNAQILSMQKQISDTWFCRNHLLYQYKQDENQKITDSIKAVYAVGDKLDILRILPEENDDFSILLENCTISEIKHNCIYLAEQHSGIPIHRILEIFSQDEKNINFTISQMAEDFAQLLTGTEKQIFLHETPEKLSEIYHDRLENRYHLTYPSHDYLKDYDARHDDKNLSELKKILHDTEYKLICQIQKKL